MFKWKEHIEQRKNAETTPEGKRKIELVDSFARELFFGVIFVLVYFLVPDDWKLFPLIAAAICGFLTFIDSTEYNNIIKNEKQSGDDNLPPQEDETSDI